MATKLDLKERRKARLRVLAIRSTIGATALAVLGLLLLYWLLQTVAGREVLMAQVVARLPADASLTWERAEGPLAGPLILHDVDFRWGADIHFAAKRAYLDPDIRPLLGRKLRLDALQLTDAQLNLGRSEEPFELPSWPESLPQVEMPLAIQADTDPLPTILGGVPLAIRTLKLALDRDGFMVNPTSCAASSLQATFTAVGGATSATSAPVQPTGCENLPFAPQVKAEIGAPLANPSLKMTVTTPPGNANIQALSMALPKEVGANIKALRG